MVAVEDLRTTAFDTAHDHREMTDRVHGMLNTAVWSTDYVDLHTAAADAVLKGRPLIIAGEWTLASALNITCDVVALPGATITSTADPAIILGDDDNRYREKHISLPDIVGGGVLVKGLSDCVVHLGLIQNAAVGLDIVGNARYGAQTNYFYLGRIEQPGIAVRMEPVMESYVLGNVFVGGHIRRTPPADANTAAILVEGYIDNIAGRARFVGTIIEGQGFENVVSLDRAAYCEFVYVDWNAGTSSYNMRSVNSERNIIIGGYNLRAADWTVTGGDPPVMIGDEWLHMAYTSGHALMALHNQNSDDHSVLQIKGGADDLYDNADWRIQVTANRLEMRADGDAYARLAVRMDGATPGIYMSDGTFYPNTALVQRNAAGNLQTNDIDFASSRGPVLIDTATGTRYRLRVTNGNLAVDALGS